MSVFSMCNKETKGAYLNESYAQRGKEIWMHEEYKGLVVDDREYNGYDDSDFYAVVYVPEKDTFEKVTYGTTRFWTYPNHAVIDASEEIKARYLEWLEEQRIKDLEAERQQNLEMVREACGDFELTDEQVFKLKDLGSWQVCADLLKVKKFRSKFRESLRTQLESWLSGTNSYESPFSRKQWECLLMSNVARRRRYA